MISVSSVLLSIYSEIIVLSPDFYSFLAFVFFMIFISDLLSKSLSDLVQSTRLSYFQMISKSKQDHVSNLSERIDEANLVSDTAELLIEISNNNVFHSYTQEDDVYHSAEHTMTVGFVTHVESFQLTSLVTALYELSALLSNQLFSTESISKKS